MFNGEGAKQATNQSGFPAAEVAAQVNPHPGADAGGQLCPQGCSCAFVRQIGGCPVRLRRRLAMILRMGHLKAVRARRMRPADLAMLAAAIKSWGRELGFQAVGITDTDLSAVGPRPRPWVGSGLPRGP